MQKNTAVCNIASKWNDPALISLSYVMEQWCIAPRNEIGQFSPDGGGCDIGKCTDAIGKLLYALENGKWPNDIRGYTYVYNETRIWQQMNHTMSSVYSVCDDNPLLLLEEEEYNRTLANEL